MGRAAQPLNPSRLQRAFRRLYGWAAHRLYHELAGAYEAVAWLVSLGRWDGWRKQALDCIGDDRVLEIGFGTGALLVEAARRGLNAWGADPSIAMHRVAGRRARRSGMTLRRVVAPSQALPFASGTFGAIISTFPTEYIADPATLREAARLLRDPSDDRSGGRLVITGLGVRVGGKTDEPVSTDLNGASRAPVRSNDFSRSASDRLPSIAPSEENGKVEPSDRLRTAVFRLVAWVMRLIFGGGTEDTVALYARFAEQSGFDVTIVEGVGPVRVPVLILEKPLSLANSGAGGGEP